MSTDAGQRLFISRATLAHTRFAADPDASAARPLAEGQARLALQTFALTANNITYAAFGQAMKYWQFFPADDPAWGCLPVWGFATVTESRAAGVEPGRRVWGYYPAGTHLVVQPARVRPGGFADASAHRAELAAVYNHYTFCDADPLWQPHTEGLQAVLRPLFTTSFLLDDFLADNGFFGAHQLLLSSASSKTAFATAFCASQRRGSAGAIRCLGLTSPANTAFVSSLGCYDEVLTYDALATLGPTVPTVYVDFAGDAALRRRVHEHFGERLCHSASIGGTHWQALGSAGGLPGPRPTLFFAPARVSQRSAPPPQGWGREGLEQRIAQAWLAFVARATSSQPPWVELTQQGGPAATEAVYQALLAGRADARQGCLLSLQV